MNVDFAATRLPPCIRKPIHSTTLIIFLLGPVHRRFVVIDQGFAAVQNRAGNFYAELGEAFNGTVNWMSNRKGKVGYGGSADESFYAVSAVEHGV